MLRSGSQASTRLAAVTSYFNPQGYESRLSNYKVFRESLDSQGVRLFTVECAFPGQDFVLDYEDVTQVRARDVMWQKERLLNVAIQSVPDAYDYVAWLDCDIVFEDAAWAAKTTDLADRFGVVQPFSRVVRYDARHRPLTTDQSFCAGLQQAPEGFRISRSLHGHVGFAWAARREIIADLGLYDACLGGSGDHLMAHAFCGDLHSSCISSIVRVGGGHWQHFAAWARRAQELVGRRMSAVEGVIAHLWHGDLADRHYRDRNRELKSYQLNPTLDLRFAPGGCWAWASDKPALHRWARDYFVSRREDG